MSGAGRSEAADVLEDLGFFVIDNLPPALIPKVAELARGRERPPTATASWSTSAPARSSTTSTPRSPSCAASGAAHPGPVPRRVRRGAGPPVRGDAAAGTRSPATDRVIEGIADGAGAARGAQGRGRRRHRHVEPQRPRAARPAARAVRRRTPPTQSLQTSIVSFGYKHGLPLDVDLVFDCRFLPNPHWIEELRPLAGHRPTGARVRAGAARDRGVPRRARAALRAAAPGLRAARASRTCRSASAAPAAATAAS